MRSWMMLLVGLTACGPRDEAASDQSAQKSEQTNVEAEERAIKALGERHAQAAAARDTAHIADIYAEDVVYLPADGPAEHGHSAVREAWTRGLQVPDLVIRYVSESIEVAKAGDMAYERGLVHVTQKDKPVYEGNYVYIWKKQDGQWRVPVYMWNTRPPEK
jgi:uncharacterized protein (TIGR02246 family)